MMALKNTTFEDERELLLSAAPDAGSQPSRAVAADTTPHYTTSNERKSVPTEPMQTRKRSAVQGDVSTKRIKVEPHPGPSDHLHVHPARRELLDGSTEPQPYVKTWRTLSNTVRRQWDPKKDDLDYEFLLHQRREEHLPNVDRYVPGTSLKYHGPAKRGTRFPLERLSEDILKEVFKHLLVSDDAITVDFYWLRSFVRGHAREPKVLQKVNANGSTYIFPVGWNQLSVEVQTMKDDMSKFKKALEAREAKTRPTRSPCRGLATSLLRVSRKINKTAADVFYGENIFRFPCSTSAWIQLDSFLITIGARNAANIQRLQVHAPVWHRFMQEDYVEGAIMDSLSPATRMGVLHPPAHDRVLSAIQNAVQLLSVNLKTFAVDLADGAQADHWTGRYVNDKRMIPTIDAEEHVTRKMKGIELLKGLSAKLVTRNERNYSPVLSVANLPQSLKGRKEFQKQLPSIKREATKYGWYVGPGL